MKNEESIIEKHQAILDDETRSLDERNAAYLAIREEEVRRLNAAYDFNTIEGIQSIPVPCKEVNNSSPTGEVYYYLKGKCFANYWNAGQTELALACLYKAQEFFYYFGLPHRKDFIRLVVYLYAAGKNEEAETELRRVDRYFANRDIQGEMTQRAISNALEGARSLETDLIEVFSYSPSCAECAKYNNRIYSICGQDKRFPPFKAAYTKCSHSLKCLSFSPFVEHVNVPAFECNNIVEFSRRPFKDERSPDEIKRYDEWAAMIRQQQETDAKLEYSMIEDAKARWLDTQTLRWLQKEFPSLAPKSLSGYRRMRTMNTKNFQTLQNLAAGLGRRI